MNHVRRLVCTGALVLGLLPLAPGPAGAHEPRAPRAWAPVAAPLVSMTLTDHRGVALPTVDHHGRTFVAGERGERYAIMLANNTAQRLEVVVSVDGRDVVSGQPIDPSRQRGYVLEPRATVTIDGYRRSLEHVAAFRFSGVQDSYAARNGARSRAGIVSVAVFREHGPAALARPSRAAPHDAAGARADTHERASTDAAPPSRRSPSPTSRSWRRRDPPVDRQELGTEFGETRRSTARTVAFVRQRPATPDFSSQILYDSAGALQARGVPIGPTWHPLAEHETPRPWGRTHAAPSFAPPPPPRRR